MMRTNPPAGYEQPVHHGRPAASALLVAAAAFSVTAIIASGASVLPAAAAEKTKLVVFVGANDATQKPQQEKVRADFEKLHPNVQVDFLRVPWPWEERFNSLLAAGMPPDAWMPVGMEAANEYVEQNVWRDLNPLIRKDGIDTSRYFKATLDATTFRGLRYGLPVAMYTDAVFYNKDLLEQAGLAAPPHTYDDASWTWDKYLDYGKKLTRDTNGDGVPEIWGLDGIGHPLMVAESYGAFPYSADFRKANFDSAGMVTAYRLLQDIQYKYHVSPTYEQRVAQNLGGVGFYTGKVGMLIDFTSRARMFIPVKGLHWDLAAKPRGPAGPKVLMYLDTVNIIASAPHQDLAWEWVKYISQPEVLPALSISGFGAMPPVNDGAALYVKQMSELAPGVDWMVFIRGAQYANPPEFWRPEYQKTNELWDNVVNQINANKVDVPTALKTLNDQVQALLDKYWASRK